MIPCHSMKVLIEKIGPAMDITPSKIDRLSSSIVIVVHEQQSICVYYSAGDYSCRNRANLDQEVLKLHVLESPCTKGYQIINTIAKTAEVDSTIGIHSIHSILLGVQISALSKIALSLVSVSFSNSLFEVATSGEVDLTNGASLI